MTVVSYNDGAMTSALGKVGSAASSASGIRAGMKKDVETLTNPAVWSGTDATKAAAELAKIDGYMEKIEMGIGEIKKTLEKVKNEYSQLHF